MARFSLFAAAGVLTCLSPLAAAGSSRGLRLNRQQPSELSPLLSMTQATEALTAPSATTFGPDGCVKLARSSVGTCVIKVACGDKDVSQVAFSFVCHSKESSVPKAEHAYGVGGFDADEVFDSGISCDSCTTVEYAKTNNQPVHNELLSGSTVSVADPESGLAKAPSQDLAKAPSQDDFARAPSPSHVQDPLAKAPSPGKRQYQGVKEDMLPPSSTAQPLPAFFGPSACVSTFLSDAGTCIIQTRCRGVDMSNFAVGVTCLDKKGDYTKYLFGKNGFEDEETFDTSLRCQACIGVGDKPTYRLSGLVPKNMVEDLSSLKTEIRSLQEEVVQLKDEAAKNNATNKATDSAESGKKSSDDSSQGVVDKGDKSEGGDKSGSQSDKKAEGNSTKAGNNDADKTDKKADADDKNAGADDEKAGADDTKAGADDKKGSKATQGKQLVETGKSYPAAEGSAKPKTAKLRDLLRRLAHNE